MKTDGLYFKHPVGRKIEDIHSVSLESGVAKLLLLFYMTK